jgi:hypothetical protein
VRASCAHVRTVRDLEPAKHLPHRPGGRQPPQPGRGPALILVFTFMGTPLRCTVVSSTARHPRPAVRRVDVEQGTGRAAGAWASLDLRLDPHGSPPANTFSRRARGQRTPRFAFPHPRRW